MYASSPKPRTARGSRSSTATSTATARAGKASATAWPEIRVGRSTCSDTPACLPRSADGCAGSAVEATAHRLDRTAPSVVGTPATHAAAPYRASGFVLWREADVHHERTKIRDSPFRDLCTHNHNVHFAQCR